LPWLVACGAQAGARDAGEDLRDEVSAGAPESNLSEGSGSDDSGERALSEADLSARWQELAVPGPGQVEAIARVPTGFLALRRESVGDAKLGLLQSHLYESVDGVGWSEIPLGVDRPNFGLRGLAYANGRYVMAGDRYLWTSNDGKTWSEEVMGWNDGSTLASVVVSNGRFFGLGTFRRMLTSADGVSWTELDMATVQQTGVAFGDGKYVLTGSGPIQLSRDGLSWQSIALDCALPEACVTTPDGEVGQGYHVGSLYLGGHFYTGSLVSDDGVSWRESGDPPYPAYESGGYLFGSGAAAGSLRAWQPGEPPIELALEPAREGNVDLPSEVSCESHRCIVLGSRLFLLH
jgi:hypothetical protein